MALAAIQDLLSELYDVEVDADVDDFVCDVEVAEAVSADARERREVLLIAEDDEGISVGLYVCPAAVADLADLADRTSVAWDDERFGSACLATEGVSHFLYVMFRAENAESVTELELELQAEVDKYATALLAGNGVGAIRARSRQVRHRLFADVEFLDGAHSEQGARYRVASEVAHRYACLLEERYLSTGDVRGLVRELRRFYRVGLREKIERARALT